MVMSGVLATYYALPFHLLCSLSLQKRTLEWVGMRDEGWGWGAGSQYEGESRREERGMPAR